MFKVVGVQVGHSGSCTLIPTFQRQRPVNVCEFKASLICKAIPGQLGLHSEILFQQTNNQTNKQTKNTSQHSLMGIN